MKQFAAIVVLIMAFVACIAVAKISGDAVGSYSLDRQVYAQATANAGPQSFEDHALDTVKEVAVAGDAALVAVAASGDVSQTKIAQAIPSSLWAVAFILLGAVLLLWTVNKLTHPNSNKVTMHDFENEREKIR